MIEKLAMRICSVQRCPRIWPASGHCSGCWLCDLCWKSSSISQHPQTEACSQPGYTQIYLMKRKWVADSELLLQTAGPSLVLLTLHSEIELETDKNWDNFMGPPGNWNVDLLFVKLFFIAQNLIAVFCQCSGKLHSIYFVSLHFYFDESRKSCSVSLIFSNSKYLQ